MEEIMQLKAIWFDIEMQLRQLASQRSQVETKIQQLYQAKESEKVQPQE